jgi:hypothetical protein
VESLGLVGIAVPEVDITFGSSASLSAPASLAEMACGASRVIDGCSDPAPTTFSVDGGCDCASGSFVLRRFADGTWSLTAASPVFFLGDLAEPIEALFRFRPPPTVVLSSRSDPPSFSFSSSARLCKLCTIVP